MRSEQLFPPKFVQENPEAFQGTDWVHIDQLRAFMTSRGHRRSSPFVIRSSPSPPAADSSCVKHEEPDIDLTHSSPLPSQIQPRTRTWKIGGNEVTEILSSDSEGEVEGRSGLEHFGDTKFLECNPTDWQDDAVASRVVYNGEPVPITRQLDVERIEILEKLPSVWPVPRLPTAYIVDLHAPEIDVEEKGKFLTVDGLIKDKVCRNPG